MCTSSRDFRQGVVSDKVSFHAKVMQLATADESNHLIYCGE